MHKIKNYENGVYLVLTGVDNKISNRVKSDFNFIKQSKYNHIGFLVKNNNEIFTVDIQPSKIKTFPFLVRQSLDSFIEFYDAELDYMGIWRVEKMKKYNLVNAINEKDSVFYDYDFDNHSNDTLYCSEFVAKTLKKITKGNLNLILLKRKLNTKERFFLDKDSIEYYPVDFFLKDDNFVFIDEWVK